MHTTVDEQGILNNFAKEPEVSYADYPSQDKQRSYLIQGTLATVLISALVLTAFVVS